MTDSEFKFLSARKLNLQCMFYTRNYLGYLGSLFFLQNVSHVLILEDLEGLDRHHPSATASDTHAGTPKIALGGYSTLKSAVWTLKRSKFPGTLKLLIVTRRLMMR
jgi:hypothetical protein